MSDRVLHDVQYALARLGIKRGHLDRLMRDGEIAYVDMAARNPDSRGLKGLRRNRKPMFLDEDIDAFIARRRVQRVMDEAAPASSEVLVSEAVSEGMRKAARRRGIAKVIDLPGSNRYA